MEQRSSSSKLMIPGALAVILILSAGCMGFFGSPGTTAGELRIDNEDDRSHDVVIHVADGERTLTITASISRTITLVESPGNYTVNATIDGTTRVNTTVEYYSAGENGERVGGPALILEINSNGRPDFYQSVD